jgi:hypothetical protein
VYEVHGDLPTCYLAGTSDNYLDVLFWIPGSPARGRGRPGMTG